MSDVWTMVWKESRDLFAPGRMSDLIRPAIMLALIGIVLPWRAGATWLELSGLIMLLVLYVPLLIIVSYIGDTIAGERERHTLETLLASRMPDRAILAGKIIATVAYSWGLSTAAVLIGALVVNLTGKLPQPRFYPADVFAAALVLSLLVCVLAASGGVLISLRAETVRQAQQTLVVGALVLFGGSALAVRAAPADWLAGLSYDQLLLAGMGLLVVLNVILIALAVLSFQRARLIF